MLNLIISIAFIFSLQNQPTPETILLAKMEQQSKCWNEGDFECFMQPYWKSDSLKFIGSSGVTYGWTNTLERYKVAYPTEKARGILAFDILSIEQLSEDHIFMLGKWHLTREIEDLQGHFTLIWKKIDGEWLIISDHSSGE